MVIRYIVVAIAAYLIGSISPSILISWSFKKDVRNYGSGNAGATNMVRNFGWVYGLMTFFLDILKGFLCSYLGKLFAGETGAVIGAFFVVIGHMFPLYYKFKGGKGVSTSMGTMLTFAAVPSLVVYLIAVIVVAITGIVSIGSLLGFVMESIMICLIYPTLTGILPKILILVLTLLIFWAHRENIKRLIQGKENKLTVRSKK